MIGFLECFRVSPLVIQRDRQPQYDNGIGLGREGVDRLVEVTLRLGIVLLVESQCTKME